VESIQSHIAVIALGLVVILFGHDTLMMADPHPLHYGHVDHHESPSLARAHSGGCGPTTGAHPQTANGLGVDDQAAEKSISYVTPQVTGFVPHWSVDPDHPPATKRALLQVYLN
jgi:hypothetical protein